MISSVHAGERMDGAERGAAAGQRQVEAVARARAAGARRLERRRPRRDRAAPRASRLASLASWPTRGRSSAGSAPSARSSAVSSPERPSTRTRTCSRSDVDRAPAISARARSTDGLDPRVRRPPGYALACGPGRLASLAKAAGSRTASSARILRSSAMPAFFSPAMNTEYDSPSLAAGRVDADDPERARAAASSACGPVGEDARAQHGLGGGAVQLAPPADVALGLLENLLSALAGLGARPSPVACASASFWP